MTYDKNIELQEKQKAEERKDKIVEKYIKKKNRIIGQYKALCSIKLFDWCIK